VGGHLRAGARPLHQPFGPGDDQVADRERAVLDVLVDASVARSRSDALAWCVRLVGQHESDWLRELEGALTSVAKVRSSGPRSNQAEPEDGA